MNRSSESRQRDISLDWILMRIFSFQICHFIHLSKVQHVKGKTLISNIVSTEFKNSGYDCGPSGFRKMQNLTFSKQKTRCRCLKRLKWWKTFDSKPSCFRNNCKNATFIDTESPWGHWVSYVQWVDFAARLPILKLFGITAFCAWTILEVKKERKQQGSSSLVAWTLKTEPNLHQYANQAREVSPVLRLHIPKQCTIKSYSAEHYF